MDKSGPIIIMEDDCDDQELLEIVINELGITNKIQFFGNGEVGLNYLKTAEEQPFLILCDINMPLMDGIEFKLEIDQDPQLRELDIPFIYFTTTANKLAVNMAYSTLTVQGFFEKPCDYNELKRMIKLIIDYWMVSRHPCSKH